MSWVDKLEISRILDHIFVFVIILALFFVTIVTRTNMEDIAALLLSLYLRLTFGYRTKMWSRIRDNSNLSTQLFLFISLITCSVMHQKNHKKSWVDKLELSRILDHIFVRYPNVNRRYKDKSSAAISSILVRVTIVTKKRANIMTKTKMWSSIRDISNLSTQLMKPYLIESVLIPNSCNLVVPNLTDNVFLWWKKKPCVF
jgi:hypothetical protein